MAIIFISYRHGRSADIVGRIRDRLRDVFGASSVFRDIEAVAPATDLAAIQEAVSRARVVVAIIGEDWLRGKSLMDPRDWVRRELETAFAQPKTLVVPVLVNNASFPTVDDLPIGLRLLLETSALRIDSGADFETHISQLCRVCRSHILTKGEKLARRTAVALTFGGSMLGTFAVLRTLSPAYPPSVAWIFQQLVPDIKGLLQSEGDISTAAQQYLPFTPQNEVEICKKLRGMRGTISLFMSRLSEFRSRDALYTEKLMSTSKDPRLFTALSAVLIAAYRDIRPIELPVYKEGQTAVEQQQALVDFWQHFARNQTVRLGPLREALMLLIETAAIAVTDRSALPPVIAKVGGG